MNPFTCSFLYKLGVTDILCDPEYKETVDPSSATLTMEKGGYRLYKIKPGVNRSFYMEKMSESASPLSADSSFSITRELKGAAFYPGNQFFSNGYISPVAVDRLSTVEYKSDRPLDTMYIQFRAYSSSDTVRIICMAKNIYGGDSVAKMYTYSNTNENVDKYLPLPCYNSYKIKAELHASAIADRACIHNLIFLRKKD